jgi:hypothetical protein
MNGDIIHNDGLLDVLMGRAEDVGAADDDFLQTGDDESDSESTDDINL